jgi:hypothetical protein
VDELRRLTLDRINHARMAMAGGNDRDSGREIQKSVAIDVLDNGAFTVMGDERIAPGVRRRDYSAIALNYSTRPRAWQWRNDARKFHSATSRLSVCGRSRSNKSRFRNSVM